MVRGTRLWSQMILAQRGDVWSRDKLKAKHILFGKVYDHETW